MSKKSDDSIERIFRQALTQYDTPFQESDWVKMEKMLNEEASRRAAARSKRIKGTAYTLTGLTGLIIAVYFLAFKNPSGSIAKLNSSVNEMQATGDLEGKGNVQLKNPPDGLLSKTAPANSAESEEEKEGSAPIGKALPEDPRTAAGKESGLTDAPSEKKTIDPSEKNASGALGDLRKKAQSSDPDNSSKNMSTGLIPPNNSRQKKEVGTSPDVLKPFDQPVQADPARAGQSINNQDPNNSTAGEDGSKATVLGAEPGYDAAGTVSGNTSENIEQNQLSSAGAESSKVAVQDSAVNEKKFAVADSNDAEDEATNGEKKPKVNPPYRWSIGIILAPEFSTTRLTEYSAPGGSLGLRIGYQVTNRFNIKTGIIRSTKKYEGDGYDYTPRNPLYWQIRTNGVVPEEIDSKCLVYELPVGFQYDAIQTQKSRLFVSAAVSSYFMISQAYDYTFDSPNPGADTGWRSQGSESYWFSVGMLSAGYERYVHQSFAIGIEPYLKFSLAEIGWPNIKLFSAGAYVTLRYRFMNQKNNIE